VILRASERLSVWCSALVSVYRRELAERIRLGRLDRKSHAVLRDRLITAEQALAAGAPSIVVGGKRLWRKPLQQQTSDPSTVTGHHGAAAAIGRRGLGLAIRRRPAGPRTGQWTAAGTPPARPDHQPSTTHGGCGSSAHRHTHNEACRSTGKHPPTAANTVRAAQDSLLLTSQERSVGNLDARHHHVQRAGGSSAGLDHCRQDGQRRLWQHE
jgi:hypothetical protein